MVILSRKLLWDRYNGNYKLIREQIQTGTNTTRFIYKPTMKNTFNTKQNYLIIIVGNTKITKQMKSTVTHNAYKAARTIKMNAKARVPDMSQRGRK